MGDVLSEVVILEKLHLENAVNLETQLGAAGTCAKRSKKPPTPTIALNKPDHMSSSFVALSKYPGGRRGSALEVSLNAYEEL
jgi:hypothetical protein